jgi:DNA polymerase V
MECTVSEIIVPDFSCELARPPFASRISAGFPSPAESYIEGRIDFNRDFIKNQLSTYYIRVRGDSMEPLIYPGEMLVVDKMAETRDKDIVVARIGDDLCVKRWRMLPNGSIWLFSENINYKPIQITWESDFEVWGKVLHSVKSFK